MYKIYLSVICLILLITSYSCTPTMYKPTEKSISSTATLENLNQGRSIYMAKCGECHRLHRPKQYTAEVWRHNVDKMQKRAHITAEEKELVYQYLIAVPRKKKS